MTSKQIIYIIEDSTFVQDLIEFSLKLETECEVHKFTGIDAAFAAFNKQAPDIVILDYALDSEDKNAPNGLVFFDRIEKLRLKIPVIVLSGQKDKALAVKMLKRGAIDYISKNDDLFLENLTDTLHKISRVLRLGETHKQQQTLNQEFLKRTALLFGIVLMSLGLIFTLNQIYS